MDRQSRPQGEMANEVPEVDYIQRIMRSLADSSTSPAQSTDQDSGVGSSSYSFIDSYSRIPDTSPGLNPWGFFPPPPDLRGIVGDSPNWRSPCKDLSLSPIQREILADFPWLHEELAASTSVVSKEESDACTSVGPLEPSTDQVAWAQSMLELRAFDNSTCRLEAEASKQPQTSPVRSLERELRSTSATPANSETPFNSESLSSSLSDGEAELKESTKKGSESGTEAAGTSARSGKRKRSELDDADDAPSDDQELSKKPINRPRKKGGGVKRVREPRYAIKTRTDTEVMDDGYKWRKYGQKAVKNSPHPRNYYRCTTANCPVRKRVERCVDDPSLVVTTYEGTHTHQLPSFLRGPAGYPGGLQGLLATLTHHYNLAGNAPLPPFGGGFPLPNSDLYRSSPLWLSQPPVHENLNLLRAHEQLIRLQQQEAAWASSMSNEPAGSFQFPGQRPTYSSVSSLSDLGYDIRMNSLPSTSLPEQLGTSQIINPFEYSSLISTGPFSSAVVLPDQSTGASSNNSGLLEDMFRHTNPSSSRA